MTTTRTLDAALTAEQTHFLKADAKSASHHISSEDKQESSGEARPQVRALASLNVRIHPDILADLKQLCRQREQAGIKPHTQKEIVELALQEFFASFSSSAKSSKE